VLYHKTNIKHFFRIDIQLYQHSWKLGKLRPSSVVFPHNFSFLYINTENVLCLLHISTRKKAKHFQQYLKFNTRHVSRTWSSFKVIFSGVKVLSFFFRHVQTFEYSGCKILRTFAQKQTFDWISRSSKLSLVLYSFWKLIYCSSYGHSVCVLLARSAILASGKYGHIELQLPFQCYYSSLVTISVPLSVRVISGEYEMRCPTRTQQTQTKRSHSIISRWKQ
jgi:hypothetical protein